MNDTKFTESVLFKALCVCLLTGILIFLLIFFKELLKPLATGILLWYFIKAFNGLIEKIKFRGKPLNLWVRRGIALLIIVAIVEGSVRVLVSNINQIIANYPTYLVTLNSMISSIGDSIGMANITENIEAKIGELDIEGFLRDMVAATSSLVGDLLLVIVYAIFLLLEEHSFVKKMSIVFNSPGQG
ncbi:MAG: hypothetical protein WDN75_21205 [Bacteroidota bacterium]